MVNPNIIWRIDDRLIHGQVIIGWCGQLPIKVLLVTDDEIAETEWEKNLLLMAAPDNLTTKVLSTQQTIEEVREYTNINFWVLILMKSPFVLKKLIHLGLEIRKVNVGGLHFREDRREYLPYIYLSEEELEIFKALMDKDISFECRDLPNSTAYDLKKVIDRRR